MEILGEGGGLMFEYVSKYGGIALWQASHKMYYSVDLLREEL